MAAKKYVFRITLQEWLDFTGNKFNTWIKKVRQAPAFPKSRFEKVDNKWHAWLNKTEYSKFKKTGMSKLPEFKQVELTIEDKVKLSSGEIPLTKEDSKDEVLNVFWDVIRSDESTVQQRMRAAEHIVKTMALDKIDTSQQESEDKFTKLTRKLELQKVDFNVYNILKQKPEAETEE